MAVVLSHLFQSSDGALHGVGAGAVLVHERQGVVHAVELHSVRQDEVSLVVSATHETEWSLPRSLPFTLRRRCCVLAPLPASAHCDSPARSGPRRYAGLTQLPRLKELLWPQKDTQTVREGQLLHDMTSKAREISHLPGRCT